MPTRTNTRTPSNTDTRMDMDILIHMTITTRTGTNTPTNTAMHTPAGITTAFRVLAGKFLRCGPARAFRAI